MQKRDNTQWELNDLLAKDGIDAKTVLVLRHRPTERELRKVFPWLAAERPETYNAYQQTHGPKVEQAMQKAAYVASFIGHEAGKALFIGLYQRGAWHPLTYDQYWGKPAYQEMRAFGVRGFVGERESVLWFDLELTDFYRDWKGRLVVDWPPPERSWWRWADRNVIPVSVVHPQTILDAEMPRWDELSFTWDELKVLPSKWKAALGQWRGIYFIFDESDGKGYVGSAYGTDNILGRWLGYAASGHGGNKELRRRAPAQFRFSILQRVSPDMEIAEITQLESSWKDRLHTREFGMNEN
jgi:hypothetical protein